MGDVVGFKKKQPKIPEKVKDEGENVAIMVCGRCENTAFLLSIDGRVFCSDCTYPVAAYWDEE